MSYRSDTNSVTSTTSSGTGIEKMGRPGTCLAISDLRLVQRLGSGDMGSVYLAELKRGVGAGAVAAKVMVKKELEGRNKKGRARMERAILEVLDHPFLPHLYGTAENEHCLCLLTEFCPGGDLHLLRQRQSEKRFDEAAVRFYAAEVVAALEYMHLMGIIYRDLKPENVLVRSDGHIMITDFDLSLKCDNKTTFAYLVSDEHPLTSPGSPSADRCPFSAASCIIPTTSCFRPKTVPRRQRRKKKKPGFRLEFVAEPVSLRSMSFVGTHEYLAPEIAAGEEHGSAVDWWTLGVFIYEMLYGVTPFRGSDEELTMANVVGRAVEFPKDPLVSPAARDLVARLLVKDPTRRLGSIMGATAIKRHPFFSGVNWALLRCAVPPHVPPPYSSSSSSSSSRDMSDDSCPTTPVEYF